ncbi:RNA polymerase sigma factor [Actinomycetospora soli]|uniref:RNA polymerase sigma factor n=1 Tax=Actinomycetospora soli TaxID=2893887 RepID=UPI001E39EECA|nr:sigma-70 family RNA polymerase sigma factor [Actinomycetospora soli]MCD2191336.1 sigma-70 family RNA polymerase sigma factor [Actinomycetospora soli]
MNGATGDPGPPGDDSVPRPQGPQRLYGIVIHTGDQAEVHPHEAGALDDLLSEPDLDCVVDHLTQLGPMSAGETSSGTPAPDRDTILEFSDFYRDRTPKLVVFLRYLGASLDDAADVAQETMRKAYERFSPLTNPVAWTRTVAAREWHARASRARPETSLEDAPASHALLRARDDIAEFESRAESLNLVATLPRRQRQVLAATYDGATPTEIARDLGLTAATVRSTLRHARNSVAELLPQAPRSRPPGNPSRCPVAPAPRGEGAGESDQKHDENSHRTAPHPGPDARQGGRP